MFPRPPPSQGPQTDGTSYPNMPDGSEYARRREIVGRFTSQDLEPNRAPFSPHAMRKAGQGTLSAIAGGSLRCQPLWQRG